MSGTDLSMFKITYKDIKYDTSTPSRNHFQMKPKTFPRCFDGVYHVALRRPTLHCIALHYAFSPLGIWKLRICQKWLPLPPFYWAWIVSDKKYLRTTSRQFHFLSYIWYKLNICSWKTFSIALFIFAARSNVASPDHLAYTLWGTSWMLN